MSVTEVRQALEVLEIATGAEIAQYVITEEIRKMGVGNTVSETIIKDRVWKALSKMVRDGEVTYTQSTQKVRGSPARIYVLKESQNAI